MSQKSEKVIEEEKIDARKIRKLYNNLKNKLEEIEQEKNNKLLELEKQINDKINDFNQINTKISSLKNNQIEPILNNLNKKLSELQEKQEELINSYQEELDEKTNEIDELQQSLNQIIDDQKTFKEQAENLKNEILENKNKAEESYNDIDEYYTELFDEEDSIKINLEKIHNQFINKLNQINNYYTRLFECQKKFLNTKISPEEYENLSNEEKKKYLKNNEGMYQEVAEFESIKELIDNSEKNFEELIKQSEHKANIFFQENNEKFNFLCDALTKKIDDLLPGATSAGLTSSFELSKNGHIIRIILWYITFFIAIGGMCGTVYYFVIPSLGQITEFSQAIIQMFKAISINFPLIWLAALANKNIAQSRRLHEEYLHKWAIARSFVMMKNEIEQIDESEDQNLLNDLLKIYLDSIQYNPSKTLDKKVQTDNPLHTFFERKSEDKSDNN